MAGPALAHGEALAVGPAVAFWPLAGVVVAASGPGPEPVLLSISSCHPSNHCYQRHSSSAESRPVVLLAQYHFAEEKVVLVEVQKVLQVAHSYVLSMKVAP